MWPAALESRRRAYFGLSAILYSASQQPPRREGILTKWTVNRSATIGALLSRVKKKPILFPRADQCGTFLDEFACEVAEYDDVNRTLKYSHPETKPDDAMHATNYEFHLAYHIFHKTSKRVGNRGGSAASV